MKAIEWTGSSLRLLDQRKLPHQIEWITCETAESVADAIRDMVVRGAPAIGASAAYGLVLAAQTAVHQHDEGYLAKAAEVLGQSRPTAVNLAWAIERMTEVATTVSFGELPVRLEQEANDILSEDVEVNKAIGRFGAELVPAKANILTHCNAGALATAGYGTALGVVRAAHEQGKDIHVFADETRPYLQGSRLTTFELMQDNIPVTLITDSMAGFLMAQGRVDLVVVGADRVSRNGDVANKIGTYTLAVLAKEHGVPFYVACPISTLDVTLASGAEIPIEERAAEEVTHVGGTPLAPVHVQVWNPSFDVTPHRLVTALITERGVIYPPYDDKLTELVRQR